MQSIVRTYRMIQTDFHTLRRTILSVCPSGFNSFRVKGSSDTLRLLTTDKGEADGI